MIRRYIAVLSLGILVLIAGCSRGTPPAAETGSKEQPAQSVPMLLSNPGQGLDALDGYHAVAVNKFSGTVNGQAQTTSMEISGDAAKKTGSLFVDIRQSTNGNPVRQIVQGMAGNAAYSRTGDEKTLCHVTWQQEAQPPSVQPAVILPAVVSAAKTGTEQIDGVTAVHYTLNDKSLGTKAETLKGDLWLAEPGGYVVKFDLTISGGEKTFGQGRSGTQTLTYELTKINTNDDFPLPAGCQPVLTGVPEMIGARNVTRLPETLRYTTDSSSEDVVAFYKDKLGSAGWKWGEVHKTAGGDQIILFFKVDEPVSLSMRMATGKSGLQVNIARMTESASTGTGQNGEKPAGTEAPGNKIDLAKAGLPAGVTVYPGAADFAGVEGIRLEFNAPDAVDKVKEYYRSGLKKAGWAVMPGSESTPDVPMILKKDNLRLFIKISKGESGTRVELTWMKQ
jgi:hypothetical protein